MRHFLLLLALSLPTTAMATNAVALQSNVFVEKMVTDTKGRSKATLQEPKIVLPGDRLIFVVSYHNTGAAPAANFIVTNPLPRAVSYQGTPDAMAQVSINGGRDWDMLSHLKVKESDGNWRAARPEDVTHIRWAMKQAVPVGATGKLSFRGIVR
ncbi:MAG: hypothetical protein ABL918_04815 [Chakrabartia sp.]